MNSPFTGIQGAFEVFFDEQATVTTTDGKRTTFEVCVFTDGTADPLTDDMMESDRVDVSFVFKKKDWAFVQKLTRGATIRRLRSNKDYSVSEAKYDTALGWIVNSREK